MPNNKENQNSGSGDPVGDSSRDDSSERNFENRGQNEEPGKMGDKDTQAGSPGGDGKDTGAQDGVDDDMKTAGGREGQFSDKNRDSEGQWSPGASGGSSDE